MAILAANASVETELRDLENGSPTVGGARAAAEKVLERLLSTLSTRQALGAQGMPSGDLNLGI